MGRYTYKELQERIAALNEAGPVVLSCQYGMLFILDQDGGIILRIDELVDEKERLKHG